MFSKAIVGLLLICIVGPVISITTSGKDRDLTHDQLMTIIRPTLHPVVQGMLDEIQADPALKRLNDLRQWERLELALSVLMKNATYKSMIMEDGIQRMRDRTMPVYKFPCNITAPTKPAASVHQLTPGDINVVAAMGDSLTAGNGIDARSILGVILEYRGESWSVGGEYEFERNPALPNILRKYNSGIMGYSTGICKSTGKCAKLNVAIPGKTARDMSAQARDLIAKMKANPAIDYKNDWKMVTIFVGQNDICSSSCKNPKTFSVEQYRDRLYDALNILRNEMPRTFVNLVTMVDAYECKNLNIGFLCTALHLFECPCGAFKPFYEETKALNEAYQREVRTIADDIRFVSNDFAVVLQPFFQKTNLPKKSNGDVDLSYFAPDCFHFSAKGHANAALSLWNNMLEPVGKKRTSWHIGEPFSCPTNDQPYFCTNKNCRNN